MERLWGDAYLTAHINPLDISESPKYLAGIAQSSEIAIISITLVLIVINVYSTQNSSAHSNLLVIFIFYFTAYVPMGLIRIFYITYGIVDPQHLSRFYRLLSISRVIYLIMMMVALPTVLTERLFASVYINDYNLKTRRHIPILCILFYLLVAALISFSPLAISKSLVHHIAFGIGTTTFSSIFCVILLVYNLKNLRKLTRLIVPKNVNPLVRGSQLRENIHVLKMIVFVIAVMAVCIATLSTVTYFLVQSNDLATIEVLKLVMDFLCSSLTLCAALILSLIVNLNKNCFKKKKKPMTTKVFVISSRFKQQ